MTEELVHDRMSAVYVVFLVVMSSSVSCGCEVVTSLDFTISATARQEVLRLVGEGGRVLRVEVALGGCSGKQYLFNMVELSPDNVDAENDLVYVDELPMIVVDRDSLREISGATLDYIKTFQWEGFVVSNNPNARSSCSCGASFA